MTSLALLPPDNFKVLENPSPMNTMPTTHVAYEYERAYFLDLITITLETHSCVFKQCRSFKTQPLVIILFLVFVQV